METLRTAFERLTREVEAASKLAYPLAELNDLLTAASAEEIVALPRPAIEDPYRLNYVTAMGRSRGPSFGRCSAALDGSRGAIERSRFYRSLTPPAGAPANGIAASVAAARSCVWYFELAKPPRTSTGSGSIWNIPVRFALTRESDCASRYGCGFACEGPPR
jgi:hypothetical protein